MKNRLLLTVTGVMFCCIVSLFAHSAEVLATDAITENTTMPELSNSNQIQDAIKPVQDCFLLGPTAQTENTVPNVILDFHDTSEQDHLQITADESWYLKIDINAPGWLYLYEYFPPGGVITGEWIAYKWEFLESGRWKLGPFIPRENEAEGIHTYRIWFFSDGQWADENSGSSGKNLVSWTYAAGQPTNPIAEQISVQPAVSPPKEITLMDKLRDFFNQPLVLSLTLSFLIFVIIFGVYLLWNHVIKPRYKYHLQPEKAEELPVKLPSAPDHAKILLPNGLEIKLNGDTRIIGRGDLTRTLDLDRLGLISRQHFQIKAENQHFYIEDLGSANGTRLNGEDISRKGPVNLNDNDTIEPAGAVCLRFNQLRLR